MMKEISMRLVECNKKLNKAMNNYNEVQLTDINEEKEALNQEILALILSIKESQNEIRQNRRLIKKGIDLVELEQLISELENNIIILNEKIQQFNSI